MTDVDVDVFLLDTGGMEALSPTVVYDPVCSAATIETDISTIDPGVAFDAGIASKQSGLWSDSNTWAGGLIPSDGNAVAIGIDHMVYFDVDQSSFYVGLDGLVIHGSLVFVTQAPVSNTTLIPSTLTTCLAMKTLKQISGEGSLFVGNSSSDPIAAPPINQSYRTLIKWIGAPPGELITVTTTNFNGWYDLVNATTLAETPAIGATSITLTDSLNVQAGDIIAIGAEIDQGDFVETQKGRYTVLSYDTGSKVVTLTQPLEDERLLGDPVAHISRPIKIEATVTPPVNDVTLFQTKIDPFVNFDGVWLTGGAHVVDGLAGTLSCTACSIEGNFKPALYDCPGQIDLTKFTVLNAGTSYTEGALVNNMTGRIFISECTIIGGEVGVSNITGLKANLCTIQNMSTACLSDLRSSLLKATKIQGSVLGAYNGGHNKYIDCALANNVVDAQGEYEAETYRLTLGNPLSLGLPVGVENKIWYTNKSFYHNTIQTDHRVWCVGGFGLTQNLITYGALPTWQFVIQAENKPIFWDTAFLGVEGEQFTISAALQKDFLGGTVSFQILDYGKDPLYEFGDAVLSETILPDELNQWRVLSVSYVPDATRPLVARVFIQNTIGTGNVYAYLGALNAVQIRGDETVVTNIY